MKHNGVDRRRRRLGVYGEIRFIKLGEHFKSAFTQLPSPLSNEIDLFQNQITDIYRMNIQYGPIT